MDRLRVVECREMQKRCWKELSNEGWTKMEKVACC